jgi:drug/metabolite transporter (DMT)-like permease
MLNWQVKVRLTQPISKEIDRMEGKLWLFYAALAGLCWGTYVPFVQQGIRGLQSPFGSILCVGMAYFLIAVIVPIGLLATTEAAPNWNGYGITFATLAGVAGALGALCVIFANRNAPNQQDRLYIGPVIFALAPVLNTLVSLIWHPSRQEPFHFGLEDLPGWKLYVGIILTGIGAALVLYSKEEAESHKGPAARPPAIEQPAPETP